MNLRSRNVSLAIATVLALVLSTATAVRAESKSTDSETLWQKIAALDFPRDTKAPFQETRGSKLLRKPASQRGTLWIETNGDFVMQLSARRRGGTTEERRLSKQQLSLTRTSRNKAGDVRTKQRSVTLNRDKGSHQLLLSIVDVLEGNIEILRKSFDISRTADTDRDSEQTHPATPITGNWSLILTPNEPELRREFQHLLLTGQNQSLKRLRAMRNSNSWQEIELLAQDRSTEKSAPSD